MSIARLASLPGNTFFRQGAPPYLATNIAVPVTIQGAFWPKLSDNPVPAFGDVGDAKYLWYRGDVNPSLVATGETVIFGREVAFVFSDPLANSLISAINVRIAADNAFQARLRIVGFTTSAPRVFNFFDGSISPNTNEPIPPFNWQTVYSFTREYGFVTGEDGFNLQFEVKTANYAQPGGNPLTNPAGVTYSIEISNLPDISQIAESVPPTIIDPLT